MNDSYRPMSTGLPGLDGVIQGVMPGDNFVWQVDAIEQYIPFTRAFAEEGMRTGRQVIYFRFASHSPIFTPGEGIEIHEIDLGTGFESATTDIHDIIEGADRGTYFVFDCLSDLTTHWYSDLMLGNFFMLTCPLVYYLNSIAYFALTRNRHTLPVMATIRETTQLIIDVSTFENRIFIHPLKVWQRASPTMYLPHRWEGDRFIPVTDSATVSRIERHVRGLVIQSTSRIIDYWDRTFLLAQGAIEEGAGGDIQSEKTRPLFEKLAGMLVRREGQLWPMAKRYLALKDILEIKDRLIGSGMIGGKTLGMLLGRAILKQADPRWETLLEVSDSFYIGSDVFYTYIVMNGCWWVKKKQRDAKTYLDDVFVARQNMLRGEMPAFIIEPLIEMLDYFGQSPIIVRSSSLLDESLGNDFTGIYESVFCVNQGGRSERLEEFINAVRKVYASALSGEALDYRAEHGQLDSDEQMALLVQRVSGTVYGTRFSPRLTGTGTLTGNGKGRGEITLVAGIDRDLSRTNDITRILFDADGFTLDSKLAGQETAEVLNLHENTLETLPIAEFTHPAAGLFTFEDPGAEPLLADLRDMLGILADAFGCAVSVTFTITVDADGTYRINLLECRPSG